MFGFRVPTRVHIAAGSLNRLPEALGAVRLRRFLLVIDPGLLATEWPDRVRRSLTELGHEAVVFDDVEANPRTTTATKAADVIREKNLDGVVGLGGGSVLDVAKAAAMLATNEGRAEHFEGRDRYADPPLPFVAVPTTCGTGSEVTWVSVLTHEPTHTKISIKGESMFPRLALVDADLLRTLPARLVASTGMDALTHALEATTCRVSNLVSDALAEKAITLLLRYLERATSDVAGDDEAREAVMRASTIAGLAFGNADVAGVHCLSEALGGLYDVPHGLANAVLLTPVLRSHGDSITARLAELERLEDPVSAGPVSAGPVSAGPVSAGPVDEELAERFLSRVENLARQVDIPPWSTFDVGIEDYARIAETAVRNGSNGSNPRIMTAEEYRRILEGLSGSS